MHRYWKVGVAASLLVLLGARDPRPSDIRLDPPAMPRFDGTVSVLTYNVKGLPWPVAIGRYAALSGIASHLRDLRKSGRAPHIVVLQETFTTEAQSIGAAAGYRYVVRGPNPDTSGAPAMTLADRDFASGAHWWKGETAGKYVGSGLQILSDYPVENVRRIAFPAFACAGFDCLANKGALLATVVIPGAPTPIDVLTTHLNSRRASHVGDDRSIYAYRRQFDALTDFIRTSHDARYPLIAAGDFNVGSEDPRRPEILAAARQKWASRGQIKDAFGEYVREGGVLAGDAAFSFRRARDWQFYSDGTTVKLTLAGIDVPFGRDGSGRMLSDHAGYTVRYRLGQPSALAHEDDLATTLVRSKT